jgi:hypothetical protein
MLRPMALSAFLATMRVSGATKESRAPEIARAVTPARANGIHAGCVQGCEGFGPPAQVGTSAASSRPPRPKAGRPGSASSRGHRNDLSAPAASSACATTGYDIVGPFDAGAIECPSPAPSAARVTGVAHLAVAGSLGYPAVPRATAAARRGCGRRARCGTRRARRGCAGRFGRRHD